MSRLHRTIVAVLLACAATLGVTRPAVAQPAQASLTPPQARETREEFRRLLEGYPPSLGRLFRLDPALMTNAAYMAPYPAIAAFVQRHPDVPRNADYYLSFVDGAGSYNEPRDAGTQLRSQALNTYRTLFTQLMVFAAFISAGLALLWLVRYIVSHRRWLRAFKVQSELHTKLVERFHSSEEVLAYLRSGGGPGLLPVPAMSVESVTLPGMAAPFNRILWSIQAGVVLICGGVGLLIIKRYVIEEVGDMLLTFGVLAASLGVGFVLAALASYILSRSLGLFDAGPGHDTRATGV